MGGGITDQSIKVGHLVVNAPLDDITREGVESMQDLNLNIPWNTLDFQIGDWVVAGLRGERYAGPVVRVGRGILWVANGLIKVGEAPVETDEWSWGPSGYGWLRKAAPTEIVTFKIGGWPERLEYECTESSPVTKSKPSRAKAKSGSSRKKAKSEPSSTMGG